jgi:uncharacterized protein YgiM (DUF1202 family)
MKPGRSEALPIAVIAGGAVLFVATLAAAPFPRAIATQASETVVVERDRTDVRDMAASYGDLVATAKKKDRLAVIGRKGKWLNVRLPDGKTGWVAESSLAPRDSGSLDTFADVAGRRDAKTASGSDNTTSAKGGDEFDKLAVARGWDKEQVYAIEKRKVDPKAVRDFAAEGKLGAEGDRR